MQARRYTVELHTSAGWIIVREGGNRAEALAEVKRLEREGQDVRYWSEVQRREGGRA